MKRPLRFATRPFAALVLAATLFLGPSWAASAADSAVILLYHRFGEDDYPTTNVTLEQFEAHIAHLKSGGYTVLPVPQIVDALKTGKPLPDRTIGITIDDATRSVLTEAFPRLKAAGFPFTVFVATEAVDQHHARIMSWDDLRQLVAAGVTIGNHSTSHAKMWRRDDAKNRADIEHAQARFQAELGFKPTLFAYPYGEYNLALRDLVESMGFAAAFGQQSGAIGRGFDLFTLPRFPFNEHYGDIDRFRLTVDTLPLPVADVTPADPLLGPNPPPFGFTLKEPLKGLKQLTCYASRQGKTQLEILGETRVEARVSEPFPPGRSRINCTMPGPHGRWRWFGMQYIVPPASPEPPE